MTEMTQPLVAAPNETISVAAQPVSDTHAVTFSEVVYAHFNWWHHREGARRNAHAAHAFDDARVAFEKRHGELVNAYWCSHVESAVALTQKRRLRGAVGPVWGFHRETDWATQDFPDVAAQLHRCDELAVRASAVLKSVRQRICLQLVFASASHLLGLVDARAGNSGEAAITGAVAEGACGDRQGRGVLPRGRERPGADGLFRRDGAGHRRAHDLRGRLSGPFVGDAGRGADRRCRRRGRQRRATHQQRQVRARNRRRRVPVLPRRAASADRRRVRDGDLVRRHRRPARTCPSTRERPPTTGGSRCSCSGSSPASASAGRRTRSRRSFPRRSLLRSRRVPTDADLLRVDYQQTTDLLRSLTDVRFKLLALVPTLSGAAVAVLGHPSSAAELIAVGLLGLTATLGVLLYELRNSQLSDYALRRAQSLEGGAGARSLPRSSRPQRCGCSGWRRSTATAG